MPSVPCLLKRLAIAAAISIGLMVGLIPLNLWLFDTVTHADPAVRDVSNRNFVATVINQTLLVVTVALAATNLSQIVYIRKAASSYLASAVVTKEQFKDMHPSVPEHYLDTQDEKEQQKEQDSSDEKGLAE